MHAGWLAGVYPAWFSSSQKQAEETIRLGAQSSTSGCQPRGRDRNQFSEVMVYFCHVVSATEFISASPKVRDEGSMR